MDIGLRYQVLDKGDADLSILFTTDAQLFVSPDKYTILEDDKGVLPAGNVTLHRRPRRRPTRPAPTSATRSRRSSGT